MHNLDIKRTIAPEAGTGPFYQILLPLPSATPSVSPLMVFSNPVPENRPQKNGGQKCRAEEAGLD